MKYVFRKRYHDEGGVEHWWQGWVETWDEKVIKTSQSMRRFEADHITKVQNDMARRKISCILIEQNADPRTGH